MKTAQTNPISIDIPDISVDGSILKRKAQLFTMVYNQEQKSLTLNWKITYYSDSAGRYGQPIALRGITSYNVESIANNNVKVNATTGEIILPDSSGEYPAGIDLIGQYDFFYGLAENSSINVHELIRTYGLAVDWNNK